jgi:hypothetical protein
MDNSAAQIRPDGDAERELACLLVSTSGTVPRPWPRCGVEDSAQNRSAGRLRIGDFDQPAKAICPSLMRPAGAGYQLLRSSMPHAVNGLAWT